MDGAVLRCHLSQRACSDGAFQRPEINRDRRAFEQGSKLSRNRARDVEAGNDIAQVGARLFRVRHALSHRTGEPRPDTIVGDGDARSEPLGKGRGVVVARKPGRAFEIGSHRDVALFCPLPAYGSLQRADDVANRLKSERELLERVLRDRLCPAGETDLNVGATVVPWRATSLRPLAAVSGG